MKITSYVQGILFLVLYLLSDTLTGDIDNKLIASLIDPIGLSASGELTKFWTPAQRNELIIPLQGYLLYNRLLWMGFGIMVFIFGYKLFKFSAQPITLKKKKLSEGNNELIIHKLQLPKTQQWFNATTDLMQTWRIIIFETKHILRSPMFLIIVLLGFFTTVSNISGNTAMYGVSTYPVTVKIIHDVADNFSLFFIIIITFYIGELVWRERTNKINQITDALPIKNYTLLMSKFIAMLMIMLILNFTIILSCLMLQTAAGYHNYETGISMKYLFFEEFPAYVFLIMFAFFTHAVVNNKFLGHTIVILTYIVNIALETNGYEHKLYLLGATPGFTLSDMNGFGHFMHAIHWFQLYWLLIGTLLMVIAAQFWVRGTDFSFKARLINARNRFNSKTKLVLTLLIISSFACGSFIYYNTTKLNLYLPKNERRAKMATFEREFKKYENVIQPRIISVNNTVDIFPYERKVKFKGHWWLKNTHSKNIDTIIYNLGEIFDIAHQKINFSIPTQTIVSNDTYGFYVLKLLKPLHPGDSMQYKFSFDIVYKGFENEFSQTNIVYNGTFFNSTVLPQFGYNPEMEIGDNDERKKENCLWRFNTDSTVSKKYVFIKR